MKRILAAAVALTFAVSLLLSPPVAATEDGVPVLLNPTHGGEVPLGFRGPVEIDFSSAPDGTYQVVVDTVEGGMQPQRLTPVEVKDGDTATVSRWLREPLGKGGRYEVTVVGDTAGGTHAQFTVLGGQDPVILRPRRSVARGFTGPIAVDFSRATVGYYDIDIKSADGRYWYSNEMVDNHVNRTVLRWTIDPLTKPGRYYLIVQGTSAAAGYADRQAFRVRRR